MSSNAKAYSPTEVALTLAVVAGAIGYGYYTRTQAHTAAAAASSSTSSSTSTTTTGGKKGKGKKKSVLAEAKASEAPAPAGVVPFPAVIPGGFNDDSPAEDSAAAASDAKKSSKAKKAKKSTSAGKKAAVATEDGVSTPTPRTVPAVAIHPSLVAPAAQPQVDSSSEGPASTSKKSKKKKSSAAKKDKEREKAVESSVVGLEFSTASIEPDTDGSWTRVEPRKAATSKSATSVSAGGSAGLSVPGDSTPTGTSGDSSPVRETFSRGGGGEGEKKKTLAEKKASKNRKTGVEDLLETPDYPTLARVMRIKPRPDEKPISGYSWGDYEDVAVPGTSVTDAGNHADREDGGTGSADGEEDEGGWGVVQSRKPKKQGEQRSSTPSQTQTSASASLSSSTELTKKQRQNQKKKEAEKAAKAALQSELQGAKAQHDRELLKIRMAEQAKERERAKGKVVGGGMQARVDEGGRRFVVLRVAGDSDA
ncbi:hypothetical protein DFP72DRAFT_1043187 [Ephemerocybe angulata]|uniref:Uncharacterized protein n=1 Tax=Ephemerocybe angulata TaxID=980116 RepID=A0A8H6M8A7_9AGAR|nr:hypothetical protein DFP72DRAFT_1043187 [Tulosesus angulatus]